jgi:hypothetical protein
VEPFDDMALSRTKWYSLRPSALAFARPPSQPPQG